jgi:hypothetical protein
MPCYVNGQLTGLSRAACMGEGMGAEWVAEPSLLTEPGIGNTMPPSMEYPGLIEPGVGNTFGPLGTSYPGPALQNPQKINLMNNIDGTIGTSYPGPALQNPQKINLMNNLSGPIGKSYSMGQGVQRSFTEPGLGYPNTDASGRRLQSFKEGNTNFGVLRDRAVTKHNTDAFNNEGIYYDGDTNAFGTPMDTNFEGESNFGLLRDKSVKKHNIDAFNNEGIYYDGDTDDFGRPIDTNFEGSNDFSILRDNAVNKWNTQMYEDDYPYNKKVNSTKTAAGRNNLIKTIMQAHNVDRDKARIMSFDDNIVSGLSKKLAASYQSQFQPVTGLFTDTGFTKDGEVVVQSDLENMGLGDKINMAVEDVYAIPLVGEVAEFLNPSSDLGSLVTTITDPKLREEAIEFIKQNPKAATVAGLTAYFSGKSKKIKQGFKWATKRWQSSYPINSPQGLKAAQILKDTATIYYGAKGYDVLTDDKTGIQKEPFVKSLLDTDTTTTTGDTTTTDKTKADGTVTTTTPTTGVDKNTPTNKPTIDAGQAGLLASTKKPGFWSAPVAGGAGAWDNKLFRLGEMMAYMGTPLSKRGDSPAKRWTSASTEASKLQAAMAKAGKKKGGIVSKLSPSDVGADIMTRLKKKPWFSLGGVDVGSQYNDDELTDFENLGKTKFAYWYEKTDDYEVAMKEALRELELGL